MRDLQRPEGPWSAAPGVGRADRDELEVVEPGVTPPHVGQRPGLGFEPD